MAVMRPSRVSVVVPFLNAERFLRATVESVFAQTLESWELLLVDDGSADGSTELARELERLHPGRVRYLEHPDHRNLGPSASRNLGVRRARAPLVAFLDSDDVWLPEKLARQVAALEGQPAAMMAYGSSIYWQSWDARAQDRRDYVPALGVEPDRVVEPPRLLPLFLRGRAALPPPTDVMIRRAAYEAIGGSDEGFRGPHTPYEDQAFLAKVCLRFPVLVTGDRLSLYRQHEGSLCATGDRKRELEEARAFFLAWLEAYLEGEGCQDPEVWRALRREQAALGAGPGAVVRAGLRTGKRRARKLWRRVAGLGPSVEWLEPGRVVAPSPGEGNTAAASAGDAHRSAPSSSAAGASADADAPDVPRVAVVMLSYNQRAKTLRALGSLWEAATPGMGVVLWDNGSSDGTVEAVREAFPEVRVHRHPENLGVASGRNSGARLAMEELDPAYLLFLDNDMVVEPDFVRALLEPLVADDRVGQTQAKLRFMADPDRLNDGGGCRIRFWLGSTEPVGIGEIDRGQYDRQAPCVACGGAMMVRADLFRELGGFDPVFDPFGPEDLDFSLRLQEQGYDALYEPRAVAYHEVSHSFEGGEFTEVYARLRAHHWMVFMRRHASVLQQAGFFLVAAPLRIARMLVREGRRGNLGAVRGILGGGFGALGSRIRRALGRGEDGGAGAPD